MNKIALTLAAGLLAGGAGAADITHQGFGNIAYKTTRLSSNESNYLKLPNEWAKTYGSFNKSLKVPPQIAEMVRLRISQMNRCDYCSVFHTRDAIETGLDAAKVYSIATWRTSGLFSQKEQAALGYAEAVSSLDHEAIQGAYDKLESVGFTVVEKEELTNITILMDVWSRVFLAQGKVSYVDQSKKPEPGKHAAPAKK